MKTKHKAIIAILATLIALPIGEIVLASLFGASILGLWKASTPGYQTAFQGLQAEFAAVRFQNAWWSSTEQPYGDWSPGARQFGYSLNFDPDQAADGWCDLLANQQPMVIVDDSYRPYVWTVGDKQYEMHKVQLRWAVNVWLGGTEAEAGDWGLANIVTWEPNYAGTQIWIRLVPKTFRYFEENPEQLYIAPAYIGVEAVEWASIDQDNKVTLNDPDMSQMDINPGARGETFGIYYHRGGVPVNVEQELTRFYYSGSALDPAVFRGEYWINLDLVNFKPVNRFEWQIWHKWKYPSVKLELTMYVFVVGVWKVQLREGDVPSLEPHKPAGEWTDWTKPFRDLAAGIGAWFANPFNALAFWLFLGVIVIIVLAVVAPGVLRGLGKAAEAGGKKLAKKIKGGRRK